VAPKLQAGSLATGRTGFADYSTHWLTYVCNAFKEMPNTVIAGGYWLARREKLAKFSGGLHGPSGDLCGLPAYILPNGNRDNDVPVVVAVSTIRKR
jgi:hypothetical protein